MNDRELVSVVIPMYNRQEKIKKAIDSVLNQTYMNIEVLVVDDCSTDNSKSVVEAYDDKRIHLIACEENKGANYARNIGMSMAKGDYIAFNDSDDEWINNKLDLQISYMKKNKLEASFTPYMLDISKEIIPGNYLELASSTENVTKSLKRNNVVGTPTLIISRKILDKVGYFDESMPRLQDYEYAIRIVQNFKMGCMPEITLNVDANDKNRISKNNEKLDKAVCLILKKHSEFIDFENFYLISNIFTSESYIFNNDAFEELLCDEKVRNKIQTLGIKISKKFNDYNFMRNELIKKINIQRLKNEKFAIYGAGGNAKKLYKELLEVDLIPELFIVTNKEDNPDQIYGIDVCKVDEIMNKNMPILIAVAKENQISILQLLYKSGFTNVLNI